MHAFAANRRQALGSIAALLAIPAMSGRVGAQDSLDMAELSPAIAGRDNPRDQLIRSIAAATEGRVRIQKAAEPGGTLQEPAALKAAVMAGAPVMAELPMSGLAREHPIFMAGEVPLFAMTMPERRARYATLHRYIAERLGEDGLVLLYAVPRPPQGLLTRVGFPGPDEWRGLAIAGAGAGIIRLGELAGVRIVPPADPAMLVGDVAAGRIDGILIGAELVPPIVQSAQRQSLTPASLEWHDYSVEAKLNIAIANRARLEGLSEGDRTALIAAARAVEERSWTAADQSYGQFKRLMESQGIRIVAPKREDAAKLARIGRVIADEWAVGLGLDGRSILDAIGLATSSR